MMISKPHPSAFVVLACLLTAGSASAAKTAKNAARPGASVGLVTVLNGTATLDTAGKATAVKVGTPVFEGDLLSTGPAGRVKVALHDDSVINLGPSTKFTIEKLAVRDGNREVSLKVIAGKFLVAVSKWFGSSTDYKITTPTTVAGVRGTVLWGDTQLDAVCALEGVVEVQSVKGGEATRVKLEPGKCASKMGEGRTDPIAPSAETVQGYLGEVLPAIK